MWLQCVEESNCLQVAPTLSILMNVHLLAHIHSRITDLYSLTTQTMPLHCITLSSGGSLLLVASTINNTSPIQLNTKHIEVI